MILAIHTDGINGDRTKLGFDQQGSPCCFPARPFYVELASGMRHTFESERDARASRYWHGSTPIPDDMLAL